MLAIESPITGEIVLRKRIVKNGYGFVRFQNKLWQVYDFYTLPVKKVTERLIRTHFRQYATRKAYVFKVRKEAGPIHGGG